MADEELLLNLATDGPDLAPAPRRPAGQRREKKGTGRQSLKDRRAGARRRADAETKPAQQALQPAASLKGYDLGVIDAPDQPDDTRPSRRDAAAASKAKPGGRGGVADAQQRKELQERTAGDAVDSEPFSKQDLLHAVALSMRKDASLAAELGEDPAGAAGREEADGGVVSFMDDEPQGQRRPLPRKRRQAEAAPEKPGKKRKGLGLVHPKAGELVHASASIPEELRAVVASTQAASSFQQLGLAASLASHLESAGFKAPTRIQQQCIPVLLAGRDVLASAPTGSGKTLAYLAPIVNDLQAEEPRISRGNGTFAVVLAPTRELCLQISDVLSTLLKRYHWLVGGLITGGENRAKEKARLRKGVSVLVATPGRLLDHLGATAAFKTDALRWLVLDEADRLLDLGFEKKISQIVQLLDGRTDGGRRRQSVLLSATMHSKLDSLVSLSLQDPIAVGFTRDASTVGGSALGSSAAQAGAGGFSIPAQLQQRYVQVGGRQRLAALVAVLRRATHAQRGGACKLVVFMSSCDGVEFHHKLLATALPRAVGTDLLACACFKLHGNLLQAERTAAFLEFAKCERGVLLCTDVAARGLDFPAVTCIVQYDPPGEATEYVHRVGRTARMGQRGEALLFLLPSEIGYLAHLQAAGCAITELPLEAALQALPAKALAAARQQPGGGEAPPAYLLQGQAMAAVGGDPGLKQLAGDAFRSYVRAYATHPASLKEVFHVRRLHLGHVAHSFGLKEPPTLLGRSASKAAAKEAKAASKATKKAAAASKQRRPKQKK